MIIGLAKDYGFCLGVKRAIKKAEQIKNAANIDPPIHNNEEISRLQNDFNAKTLQSINDLSNKKKAIIRTHDITKQDLALPKRKNIETYGATCPFVTEPQQLCEEMSDEGYEAVIFGDENHPEVKGIKSYVGTRAYVILDEKELYNIKLLNKVAVVPQTTKKVENLMKIANYSIPKCKEARVFNTICDATFRNQEVISEPSQKSDVTVVVGGKNSANIKQLLLIAKQHCENSYLIEIQEELKVEWSKDEKHCGVNAGASMPDWITKKASERLEKFNKENS